MASSRGTQNGPDMRDVQQAIFNYERFWSAHAEIVITAVSGIKTGDLIVVARALRWSDDNPAPRILASASVSVRSANYARMESVILKALFDLDVAMYRTDGGTEP